MTVLNFYKSYFGLLKYMLLWGTILILISGGCSRLSAFFGAQLVNLISLDIENKYTVLKQAIFFIFLYTLFNIIGQSLFVTLRLVNAKYIPYLRGKVTKDLFAYIHKHSPSFFEEEMSGNIAAKVRNVVYGFEEAYAILFWKLYQPFLTVFTVVIGVIWTEVSIGILLIFLLIGFCAWIWVSSKDVMPYNAEYAKQSALSVARLVDSISNADTVKSFSKQQYEEKYLFHQLNIAAKSQRISLRKTRIISLKQGTGRNIFQFVLCIIPLVYWYYDLVSFVDYIFIQSLIITVSHQTGDLSMSIMAFLSKTAVMQEALDLIYQPILLTDKNNPHALIVKKGEIQIKNIYYAYRKKTCVFKDFSLNIKPKTKVGFVGYSGCGKSTLIKLINRMYDVSKGGIFIDGQNIKDVSLSSLHRQITYIPQEPSLLNRTIRENILYARPTASEEEMIVAAKKAYIHDFIMTLPEGYDSKVGDRGIKLSGGERQRIAIARAILKDAPILILDEATSALDSETEFYIQKSLENLMKGKTVIAIAHRLSTLKKMSRIVVFENGKATEDGPHSKLIKNKKLYYQFYKMQSATFIGE